MWFLRVLCLLQIDYGGWIWFSWWYLPYHLIFFVASRSRRKGGGREDEEVDQQEEERISGRAPYWTYCSINRYMLCSSCFFLLPSVSFSPLMLLVLVCCPRRCVLP
ncbi:hypothetical protein VPH35_122763 [Triticum aestivum]